MASVLLFLAGCTSPFPGPEFEETAAKERTTLEIPVPRHGTTYLYTTENGSVEPELKVTVRDWIQVKDAWLNEVDGLAFDVEYKDRGYWFPFQTVLEPSTGGIIQQRADCYSRDVQDPSRCESPEEDTIHTGSQGLPGALGAGPFWNDTVSPGEVTVDLHTPLPGNENWTYDIDPPVQPRRRGSCLSLSVTAGDLPSAVVGMAYTAAPGRLTLCDGFALPVAFEALDGSSYQLIEVQPGDGSRVQIRQAQSQPETPVVPLEDRSFPVYASHPTYPANFTAREAHGVARERSDAYGTLFASDPNATVVYSHYAMDNRRRSELTPGPSSWTYTQSLHALDSTGRRVDLKIEKTVEDPMGPEEKAASYEVTSEEQRRLSPPLPTPSTLADRGTRMDAAVDLGERLTGQPWDEWMGFGRWGTMADYGYVTSLGEQRLRSSSVVVWLEDAHPEASGGIVVETPYRIAVDSATGALMEVFGDAETLNRTMR